VKRKAKPGALARLTTYALALAIVVAGFAMLMVRLEVTQEGYRLSALKIQVRQYDDENQRLRLQEAELKSHQRLRLLAARYGMGPPAPGRVMVVR
jgi:cell division protein FtsL